MKAGDIKKCLEKAILSQDRRFDPKSFNIHDNFILSAFSAYRNGESSEYIKTLVESFITTEELTVHRRVAVLRMIRDVLTGLSKPGITDKEKTRLKSLLTAYFI
jgi:hypothetical protein